MDVYSCEALRQSNLLKLYSKELENRSSRNLWRQSHTSLTPLLDSFKRFAIEQNGLDLFVESDLLYDLDLHLQSTILTG